MFTRWLAAAAAAVVALLLLLRSRAPALAPLHRNVRFRCTLLRRALRLRALACVAVVAARRRVRACLRGADAARATPRPPPSRRGSRASCTCSSRHAPRAALRCTLSCAVMRERYAPACA